MLIFVIHRCEFIESMRINYWLKNDLTEEESSHAAQSMRTTVVNSKIR